MSETLQDLTDVPKEFFKDGTQFLNRCTKRMLFVLFLSFSGFVRSLALLEWYLVCDVLSQAEGLMVASLPRYFQELVLVCLRKKRDRPATFHPHTFTLEVTLAREEIKSPETSRFSNT